MTLCSLSRSGRDAMPFGRVQRKRNAICGEREHFNVCARQYFHCHRFSPSVCAPHSMRR